MTGVSLSRWTMSYFAAALFCLLAAEGLMTSGWGFPHDALQAPETLILVHVTAIGWLSLLLCGALFQFVPVLVAHPIYSNMLPLPTLIALLAGLGALVLGFLQLADLTDPAMPFFPLAAILLGSGFTLALWNLFRTLWAARARPLPAWFVVTGLSSIAATAIFGIVFALVLGGTAAYGPLIALTKAGLPIHVLAGAGGWLTFTAMGVSYRLFAMFMLAPDLERLSTKAALVLGTAALIIAVVGGALAILFQRDPMPVLSGAGGAGLGALVLYVADVRDLYRLRRRPNIELNSRMAAFAVASLAASVAWMIVLLALGRLSAQAGAVLFLLAFGWLSGLGLAQLYKIVAFLTWLEYYGPVLGKAHTPRVQDLVVEKRAAKWFRFYFLAVWAGTASLVAGYPVIFQLSAAAMLAATGGIIVELLRIRRLADVKTAFLLPQDVHRPRLLFSPSHQI